MAPRDIMKVPVTANLGRVIHDGSEAGCSCNVGSIKRAQIQVRAVLDQISNPITVTHAKDATKS